MKAIKERMMMEKKRKEKKKGKIGFRTFIQKYSYISDRESNIRQEGSTHAEKKSPNCPYVMVINVTVMVVDIIYYSYYHNC